MPDEKFPQLGPKQEMTQQQIEGLLLIKIDPSVDVEEVMYYWDYNPGRYLRYIVTPSWDIILSPNQHNELVKIMGVDREDCLVGDGDLKYDNTNKTLEFIYNWSEDEKIPHIRSAAEQKIKEYLNKKGLLVEKITYIRPHHRSF